MIHADESHEIKYIDPSGISTFSRCPAKYFFSRILGLHTREGNMIAPDFGTAIHAALPYCYSLDTLQDGLDVFTETWKSFGYSEDDKKRNTLRGHEMLKNFCVHRSHNCPYERQNFSSIAPPEGVKRVNDQEVPFLVDIGGALPLAGRIDCIVKWKTDGKIRPLDYKTASEISQRLFDSFWNAPQALGYTVAVGHITGELPPGMLIEPIRVSPSNDEVSLFPVDCGEHLVKEFIGFANGLSNAITTCNKEKRWPTNPTGCASYSMFGIPGACCPYQMLCGVEDWHTVEPLFEHGEVYHPFDVE